MARDGDRYAAQFIAVLEGHAWLQIGQIVDMLSRIFFHYPHNIPRP
jgi:hypothetical protein